MKVTTLPARQNVHPGHNQNFLPETVSGSLQLTAHHTGKARDTFFRFYYCESSEKIVGTRRQGAWEPIL